MGGPKWSEGLPYHGPLGLSTASLMAVGLSTVSDGDPVVLIALDNPVHAVGNEYLHGSRAKRTETFHVGQVAIYVSLGVHVFGDCNTICQLSQSKHAHQHALSGVETKMSMEVPIGFPAGPCGPSRK